MKFLAGQYLLGLWGLIILPPLFALFILQSARSLRILLGATRFQQVRGHWLKMQLLSYTALGAALAMLLLAAADPVGGREQHKYIEGQGKNINIALVVDVSRSMTATDIEPSRLQRSSQLLQLLLQALPESMFTLIVFKGSASTLVPPTYDRIRLEQALSKLSPQLLHSTGTRIDEGLRQAINTLKWLDNPRSAIVLLSDGGDEQGVYSRAGKLLQDWEGQFYLIGVGSREGSQLFDQQGTAVQDRFGNPVISQLQQKQLKRLASHHHGYYFDIGQANLHQILRDRIASLEVMGDNSYGLPRHYGLFIIMALLLLLLAWLAKTSPLSGEKK